MIKYIKDIDNVVTLLLDTKEGDKNIIHYRNSKAFLPVITQLKKEKAKGQLAGVIIASGKKNFLSGGDPTYLYKIDDSAEIYDLAQDLKSVYRSIETIGVPVVSAISGDVIGSGFEFVLASHYRVSLRKRSIRLALHHIHYGLIPGGGGCVRLLWKLGLEKAYPILVSGQRYNPIQAHELGLIDELVDDEETLYQTCKKYILSNDCCQAWDLTKPRIPNGTLKTWRVAEFVTHQAAALVGDTRNSYPAKQAILNTLVESCAVDFDTALRIESRYFTKIVMGWTSRNMVKAFWSDVAKIKAGLTRPKVLPTEIKKIGIVGAGRMGANIAFASVSKGIQVVLRDVSVDKAEKGKRFVEQELDKLQSKLFLTADEVVTYKENVVATDKYADFEDCDLVIEAVFEQQSLKQKVNVNVEKQIGKQAIYASNTHSFLVEDLAKKTKNSKNFIGVRFFLPIVENKIVEIIRGKNTSNKTVATVFDYLRRIEKYPVLVKDSDDFFTSRVRKKYIEEAFRLLLEGENPATIEHDAKNAGMEVGPLEEADLIFNHTQSETISPDVKDVLTKLKKANRMGEDIFMFYEQEEGQKRLWNGIGKLFKYKGSSGKEEVKKRLMFIQVLEALKCLEDGTVQTVEEINIGTIYGNGFALFKGGCLQYINDMGLDKFIATCKEMKEVYGDRFAPTKLLVRKAKKKELF